MKYHPDRNKGDTVAEEKFKTIKQAYETLSDPQKRSQFDHGPHPFQGRRNPFHDFMNSTFKQNPFEDMFSQRNNVREHGQDVNINFNLPLSQLLKGHIQIIEIPTKEQCQHCEGTGSQHKHQGRHICQACKGTGAYHVKKSNFVVSQPCPTCRGEGVKITDPCVYCHGSGFVVKGEIYQIHLKATPA